MSPGLAAVIGPLNDLPEPSAGLRGIDSVGVNRRTLQVIELPPGKVRAAYFPVFALAIRREDESALASANQYTNSAHLKLLLD